MQSIRDYGKLEVIDQTARRLLNAIFHLLLNEREKRFEIDTSIPTTKVT